MSVIERDPSGLLERVPELGRLAESHGSLRRAIEQGKPHEVHRALFWIRLLGRAGADSALIGDLLANRRLFIQPLNGTPTMVTYNGVGARVYGEAEPDAEDQSHIKTLFLVLLFVPVYPFSAYLVRSSSGRSWTFFGKVPLSPACYLWQRAVALAGVVAVLIGALNAFGAMRYNTVHVANALPFAVQVRVGKAAPVTVASQEVASVRARVGVQPVEVKAQGRVLEQGDLEVKRGYDAVAWNVLGAAPLYFDDVVYTSENSIASPPSTDEPNLLCGEHSIVQNGVNYVFSTPPEKISMSETEHVVHKTHLAMATLPPLYCVFKLGSTKKTEEAEALARTIAQGTEYDLETVTKLAQFFAGQGNLKVALELSDAGRQHHDGVLEFHRLYQSLALSAGLRTQLTAEYRARAEAHADSGDDAYLLGRVMVGADADRFVSAMQARFPQNPYLCRNAAFRALWRTDYAEVERLVDSLHTLDLKGWQETLELELRALAATGKIEKARGLAAECLKSSQLAANNRFDTVVASLLLARFEPPAAADAALASLSGDNADETKELRLIARVNACSEPVKDDLQALPDKQLKERLELELKARTDPSAALAQIASAGDSLQSVAEPTWALLISEAARLDAHHPALGRLLRWSPWGRAAADALVEYVQKGTLGADLEESDPEELAAADFVRSREPGLDPVQRDSLRGRAAREDSLHGVVSLAMNQWPK